MATAQEQFADFARRGQETLTAALMDWTATWPDPALAVEQGFELAEQFLRTQRSLAASWLTATALAAEAAAKAAKDAADRLASDTP